MKLKSLGENSDRAAELLALMGNGKRLQILCHLAAEEMPVNAIADRVGLSQSALSQHLAKLRQRNIVKTRREGQMIYYSFGSCQVHELLLALELILFSQDEQQRQAC